MDNAGRQVGRVPISARAPTVACGWRTRCRPPRGIPSLPPLEAAGYKIVLHVRDEIVAEVPEGFGVRQQVVAVEATPCVELSFLWR